jgi:Protein of unknown function (DUF2793)
MSDQSSRLSLPYILGSQADKHVTLNEVVASLDALVQCVVQSRSLITPPTIVDEGQAFIVAQNSSGAWANQSGKLAIWNGATFRFQIPDTGWQAWVIDEACLVWRVENTWKSMSEGAFSSLGIKTTADATNRFSVASPASLFVHDGAGHILKVVKASKSDTASLLFQTAYSGRAEVGLAGTNDFSVKVSPDGSNWQPALVIAHSNGGVTLPAMPMVISAPNLLINADFNINQREFAGGNLVANSYGFDRWKAGGAGANLTVASDGIVTLASGRIGQVVEPQVWTATNFGGQAICFTVKNPTNAMIVEFAGQSATIAAGSGRKVVRFDIPTTFTSAPTLWIEAASSGTISFSQPKIELGTAPSDYVSRARTWEETLAKRYFLRITGPLSLFLYAQSAGNYFFNNQLLPVTMRVTPSVTRLLSASGNIFQNDLNNASAAGLSPTCVRLSIRSNAAGEAYANYSRVDCDAEL